MKKTTSIIFIVLILLYTFSFFPLEGYSAVTQISDPGLTDYDIAGRVRNGLNGWELAAIYEDPFAMGANKDFSSSWLYGTYLDFNFSYTVSTGTLSIGVDYDNSGTIASNETATYTFSEYAGKGFQYLDMMLVGTSSPNPLSDANVQNLNINGTSFGSYSSNGVWSDYYFNLGSTPSDILITGQVDMTASGGSQERPKMEFKVGTPVVPEPVSSILFVIGATTLGLRRFWKKSRN
jgi:hypothetical protein